MCRPGHRRRGRDGHTGPDGPGHRARAAAEDGPVVYDGSDVDPELLTGQAVTWRQGDDVVELAVVDAGVDGSAAAVVTIPAGARAGTGELAVGIATPVVVSVVGP